ncbi:MAG: hypothetical protein QY306_06825 [Anaerolineales bacterium]|nr:MAG: hypothetical protein QY306_06825 [Anaerolineales bacterium]
MSELSVVAGILLTILSTIIKGLQISDSGMKVSIRNLIARPSNRGQNNRQLIVSFIGQCIGLLWLVLGIVISKLPASMMSTWSKNALDLASFYLPIIIGIILFKAIKTR